MPRPGFNTVFNTPRECDGGQIFINKRIKTLVLGEKKNCIESEVGKGTYVLITYIMYLSHLALHVFRR